MPITMAHAVTKLPRIRKVYNSILWQDNEYQFLSSAQSAPTTVWCLRPDHCHIMSPAKFQVLKAVLLKTRILCDMTAETHSVTFRKI
jgi:hypothetical protein